MRKIPVIAAIVNYNMADELRRLLPQVMRQGYDAVFVLDDASTDDSREVVDNFAGVTFVAGDKNRGAGGNRNRILGVVEHDALVHFLDADIILETSHTAQLVREAAPIEPFGFVGGLIKNANGLQSVWNYGSGMGVRSALAAQIQAVLIEPKLLTNPGLAARRRKRFQRFLSDWPDPLSEPKRQRVYWSAEGNMVVKLSIFRKFGGFDESFREAEIIELAVRMHAQNIPCYFDPRISVVHTAVQVRKYNRRLAQLKDTLRAGWRYGFFKWWTANGKPDQPYKSTTPRGPKR